MFMKKASCGFNYMNITIVIDAFTVVIVMPQFGASLTVINYTLRVINYAPRVINYAPREHLW